jgi:hypothetical protein
LDGRWRRSGRGEGRRRCFMAEPRRLASGGLEFGAVLLMGFGWLRRDDATTVWMEHQTDKMEKK